jgi:hypothetical protein
MNILKQIIDHPLTNLVPWRMKEYKKVEKENF